MTDDTDQRAQTVITGTGNAETGATRIAGGRPVGFRFKGGMLQYAFQWQQGTRGGIEWRNVPSVPADAPDIE